MAFAKLNKLPGVAIFVDFKKAFDSIAWDYLAKELKVFNFKEDFKKRVRILYADISSCIINNGFASPFLKLNRGVRQGCPLSGLLFVLGIELLNLAILANRNIKGIKVGIEEVKITLYADDTNLFLRDVPSVHSLLQLLELFKRCSGLELNKTKTEAMRLGSWADRSDIPFGFPWPKDSIQALGIYFSYDQALSDKLNFEHKLNDLQNTLHSWKRRKLTLLGKVNIIQSNLY